MESHGEQDKGSRIREPDPKLLQLRKRYPSLLLQNANYFGNIKASPAAPVLPMTSNTTFEELKCVGYHPDLNLLKAVVWVHQQTGYSGGLCSAGSPEYIRFYLSWDDGATWVDHGLVSFTAYDLPGAKPLEYAVTLKPVMMWTPCKWESLPLTRAILSWNTEPPPNQPDWLPPWGNVLEARVQAPPLQLIIQPPWEPVLSLEPSLPLKSSLSEKPLVPEDAKPLSPRRPGPLELLGRYREVAPRDVASRVLYPVFRKQISSPAVAAGYAAYGSKGPFAELELAQAGVDLGQVIEQYGELSEGSGNTDYEQLGCVGLDQGGYPNLVATFTVKLPYGFGGEQCEAGSQEYVAFWVDWGDGWEWVGTAQVNTHDFRTIPAEGIQYAVEQPINLAPHRKSCGGGPVIARVRAILSWEAEPPNWDPNYKPVWGNRVETRVHVYPGVSAGAGDYTPYLDNICGIHICHLDRATGFAPAERPFGRSIAIYGDIPGAPDVTTPEAQRPRYRIGLEKLPGGPMQYLTDPFDLTLTEYTGGGGLPTVTNITQTTAGTVYFTFQEAPPTPAGWRRSSPSRLLGVWNTSGKMGRWRIFIEARDPVSGAPFAAGSVFCPGGGGILADAIIDLDNARPEAELKITHYSVDGGAHWLAAGNCGTFQVGNWIRGEYTVADEHFGSFSLTVQPAAAAHGAVVNPAARAYPAVPDAGETGVWTLNTAGMDPCGYTVWLDVFDRTIVDCDGPWENDKAFVGFCLIAPP